MEKCNPEKKKAHFRDDLLMVKQYLQLRLWKKNCEFYRTGPILNRNHAKNNFVRNKDMANGQVGQIIVLDGGVVHASFFKTGSVTFVGT